jgi:lipid-A-disaccharide synthase
VRIFFSAGEPSGDLHGSNLIRQLRRRDPQLEAVGYGGPLMAAVGCRLHTDLTALAVMWFALALANLHRFVALLLRADRYFREERPDAVVLIDYPGFNWWIARRAKARGIPVFYYSPPQIWAWAQWRVKKMRRFVDHVLCGLPFEAEWLASRGCNATYVGHPFFDEVRRRQLDAEFLAAQRRRDGPLVAVLPGSRTQEVAHNFHWFILAAKQIREAVPGVRFAVASFREQQADMVRRQLDDAGCAMDVHVGRTPELIHLADCCIAVSGSVSLELLYHAKPTVILYWISKKAFWVQSWFRKVKYITLVNLLATRELFPADLTPYDPGQERADEVLFPEYLTWEDKSSHIARHVVQWLTQPETREMLVRRLQSLCDRVGQEGAAERSAQYILEHIPGRPSPCS